MKMPNLPWSSKLALGAFAFIPWFLVWIFSYVPATFLGLDQWRSAIFMTGMMWLVVSPLVTIQVIYLSISETKYKISDWLENKDQKK